MKFSKLSSSGLAIPSTSSSVVDSGEARGSTSPPAPMDRMDVTGPASTFENPHTQTSIRQATTNLAPVLPRLPAPRSGQQTSILQSFRDMKKYSGELNAVYRFMYKGKIHTTAKWIHICNKNIYFVTEGGSRYSNITQSLVYFVCKDSMPFSVVDGIGFRRLMKENVPLYKLPTRNTLKTMIIKKYDFAIPKAGSRHALFVDSRAHMWGFPRNCSSRE